MTIKQLTDLKDETMSLKMITEAYTEIASARLKQIRGLVEKNRFFLNDLSNVYQVVKQVGTKKQLLPKKNNKIVSILITSNYHFYGEINEKLIGFFLQDQNSNADYQIIIGKTALEYIQTVSYQKPYESLIFEKDYPNEEELNILVGKIKDYSQVLVFYSELQSVMVQKPIVKDITQTSLLNSLSKNTKKLQIEAVAPVFIFEPEITKIFAFFENQVTNLLIQQAFLESELSRTASRLLAMDNAQSNADTYIHQQAQLLDSAKRSLTNEKILETYAALMGLRK